MMGLVATTAEWDEIVEYFGGACAYCLRTDVPLSKDHVIPRARLGDDSPDNLVPACRHCNSYKGHRLIFSMLTGRAASSVRLRRLSNNGGARPHSLFTTRFTEADIAALSQLKRLTGFTHTSDVVRLAIRESLAARSKRGK